MRRIVVLVAGVAAATVAIAPSAAVARPTKKPPPVKGKVLFQAPACPSGKLTYRPLRGAKVVVRRGKQRARAVANRHGRFSARVAGRGKPRVEVILASRGASVRPSGGKRPYRFVATPRRGVIRLRAGVPVSTDLREPGSQAGAASAFDVINDGAAFARRSLPRNTKLPAVIVRYPGYGQPDGFGTRSAHAGNEIFVDNVSVGDDAFEPWILLHEYGHHVLRSVADPGPDASGDHDPTSVHPEKPSLAWSEGFAQAFAAIARNNPVLGTKCRTGINLASAPAEPRPVDPRLAQHNEIAVAGAVWGVAAELGDGSAPRGFAGVMRALASVTRSGNPARDVRDFRDFLAVAGLDAGRSDTFTDIFAEQGIAWGFGVSVIGDPDVANPNAPSVVLTGPYGNCADDATTPGGLPDTEADDCRSSDGSATVADGYYTFGSSVGVDFPFLAGLAHRSGPHVVSAQIVCRPIDVDDPPCPGEARATLVIHNGDHPITTNDAFYGQRTFEAMQVPVPVNATPAPLVEFDGAGGCRVIPTGADCGV